MGNLATFKFLFSLLSGLTLLLFLLFVVLPYLNFIVNAPAWYTYSLAFITLYLVYCILSCTRIFKGRLLVVSGIAMHIGLAAFATIIWAKTGNPFFGILSILYGIMWVILCVTRVTKEAR